MTKFLMRISLTAHPLEVSLFCGAMLAVIGWGSLVYLKVKDIKKNKENGPIQFMLSDNRRRGIAMLLLSVICLRVSWVSFRYAPMWADYQFFQQSLEALVWWNALAYGLVSEAFFTYRRRERMAYLITKYSGLPGGSRRTDPPKE
jgi:hypothetical protein